MFINTNFLKNDIALIFIQGNFRGTDHIKHLATSNTLQTLKLRNTNGNLHSLHNLSGLLTNLELFKVSFNQPLRQIIEKLSSFTKLKWLKLYPTSKEDFLFGGLR